MRDFKLVYNYELKQQLAKKSVIITTIVLVLLALIGTSIPRISALFSGGEPTPPAADTTLTEKAGYVFSDTALQQQYTGILNLQQENLYTSRDELLAGLKDGALKVGFVLNADGSYETLYQDKGVDDRQDTTLGQLIAQQQKEKMLAARGLTTQELAAIEAYEPAATLTVLGKNTENNILLSMVLMVAVYMLVLIYGNITSTIIAREKDSKAMELLITSTKPTPLILGKVAASGVSGVVQFGAIILAALAGFFISQEYYDPMIRHMLMGSLSTGYVLTYIYFSVTGYILYLFLYAALGSTVSRVEDVGSATAIVQFIFIAGYVASTFVINSPNGGVAVAASLIPFTSIMVMPIRAGLVTVPAWQLILAGLLMLAAVTLFAWLSIKIYRWGSLNYGNKTSLRKIFKEALRSEKKAAA